MYEKKRTMSNRRVACTDDDIRNHIDVARRGHSHLARYARGWHPAGRVCHATVPVGSGYWRVSSVSPRVQLRVSDHVIAQCG